MLKTELRKLYTARRKTLSLSEVNEKSQDIADRFFQNFDLSRINFLHCFLSIEKFKEVNTRLILEKVWREFPEIVTAAPRVNYKEDRLESVRIDSETKLITNAWGISEPGGDDFVEAEKIDLVIVPLLCFDRKGFRVGYGKGFYDKFLKTCRADCVRVGVSFFPPIPKISDVHDLDVKIDFCVMPDSLEIIKPV